MTMAKKKSPTGTVKKLGTKPKKLGKGPDKRKHY
jgi:hypothetical protein